MEETWTRVDAEILRRFVVRVFERLNVPSDDAATAADVLIQSDLRGVDSHGVARFGPYYVTGIQTGIINPRPEIKVVRETAATALIDGGNGLGMVVGTRAMNYCIRKAKESGMATAAVTNSTHFGMAAYYSMMALRHDMIGISLTQGSKQVIPIYGKQGMFGTNPLSVAAPAKNERAFVLDMATSVVARGKFEIAARKGVPIPIGWSLDREGRPTTDPAEAAISQSMLPLGGTPEFGGHKGYGLGLAVDILCGVLSGWGYGATVKTRSAGHFFGAINVDAYRPVDDFKSMMDDMVRAIKESPKADGHDRIYIHGEIEFETEEERMALGIPLNPKVIGSLREVSSKVGVPLDI